MPSATPLSRANAKMIVTPRARRGRPNEPSDDWIAASFMEEVWPRRRGGSSESDSIPRAGRHHQPVAEECALRDHLLAVHLNTVQPETRGVLLPHFVVIELAPPLSAARSQEPR